MRIIRISYFVIAAMFLGCFYSFSQQIVVTTPLNTTTKAEALAKTYFEKGEFEKALISYTKLHNKVKGNPKYIIKLVEIYQQLERYNKADSILTKQINLKRSPLYLVDLGYNHHLQGDEEKAVTYYNQAISKILEKPVHAYSVAQRFEDHALIDFAAQSYERVTDAYPDLNFSLQLARIYGEQAKIEKMFNSYINFIEINRPYVNQAKRIFSAFISESADDTNNITLRRVLLKKIQTNPDVLWNQLLSWLFIQQRDYNKAFAQEKAIYKRFPETLQGILDLANIAIDENKTETATTILNYIITHASSKETVIIAHQKLLNIALANANPEDYPAIDRAYKDLLTRFGTTAETLDLQISYGHFIAFYKNKPEEGSSFLKKTLDIKLQKYQQAKVKLELGDILVFQEKFNEALIYYSQIQLSLKNSIVAQQARFKVAQTSYYKGDFNWAESQLKILKASTSQLIANDALDLKLLISDNRQEDSLQTALKLYAKADLLAFQNKTNRAITLLDQVLDNHKTETIVDQTLYFQAQLFEKQKEFNKAKANYEFIIENFKDDILIDDAYYALANLHINQFNTPEEAKALLERIIFNYADSIYVVEARKKYRTLRGDAIIN